jgi:hypothetical protein
MSTEPVIVGLDFGGVLSKLNGARGSAHIDTTINMENAIEVLTNLTDSIAQTRPYVFKIISYCGYPRAVQTNTALTAYPHLFNEIYFVKDRKYKAELCKYLGCGVMVDDRIEILNNVKRLNPLITTVLFGGKNSHPHLCVANWTELHELIKNYQGVTISPDPTVAINALIHNVKH